MLDTTPMQNGYLGCSASLKPTWDKEVELHRLSGEYFQFS